MATPKDDHGAAETRGNARTQGAKVGEETRAMTTNRLTYDQTTTRPATGIRWACEGMGPRFEGRTLSGGVPCLGPKGEAVKFQPLPGVSSDCPVVHLDGRPTLAAAVAEWEARIEANRKQVQEALAVPAPQIERTPEQQAAIDQANLFDALHLDAVRAAASRPTVKPGPPIEDSLEARRRAAVRASEDYRVSAAFDPEHDAEYPDAD